MKLHLHHLALAALLLDKANHLRDDLRRDDPGLADPVSCMAVQVVDLSRETWEAIRLRLKERPDG